MPPLPTFQLPLPLNGPPDGYGWDHRDFSALSTTTAFNDGLDQRDQFLGERRCVICGDNLQPAHQHCHIIGQAEPATWTDLKRRGWIPEQAKKRVEHEPRNGLIMCSNHHLAFDAYTYFIRFVPGIDKFVFVNYSGHPALQRFHCKAIALDINDRYAPFPSLFIIHEMRVRGFHPFRPISQDTPDDVPWQDWIVSGGVFDDDSGSFKRDEQTDGTTPPAPPQQQGTSATNTDTGAPSTTRTLGLDENVIAAILAATRAMPSWKACQIEGTSWTGTAEENRQKYLSIVGAERIPDCRDD